MGFFHQTRQKVKKAVKPGTRMPEETLRKLECKGCTLNKADLNHPKMKPTGTEEPFLYILGEHPGKVEDKTGKHFSGAVGRYLDNKMPREWDYEEDLRWNNCIRCSTGRSEPSPAQLSCCAPSIELDISESAPWGIVGFGNIALKKFLGVSGIHSWRGKRIPISVNGHVCWFFPLVSPGYLLDNQKTNKRGKVIESDWDKVFKMDLDAIEYFYQKHSGDFEAEYFFEPKENYYDGIEYVDGSGGKKQLHKVFDWMEEIAELPESAIDVETTSIRPYFKDSRILTIAIGTYDKTYSFPVDHPKAWGALTKVMHKKLKWYLLNSGKKIAHNLNMEQEWFLYNYGDEIIRGTEWDDTMAQGYVLDTRKGTLSLEDLVLSRMGFNLKALTQLDKSNMISEPLRKVLPYNCLDTKYTHRLWQIQKQILELPENKKLIPVWEKHIVRSGTIVRMQAEGLVPDNMEVIRHQRKINSALKPILKSISQLPEIKKFKRIKGREFNPNSNTDDLIVVFKDILKRKEVINAAKKTGHSVDEGTLKRIPKSVTKLPGLLLEMRSLEKLRSTYVDSIQGYTYFDGLIHPNYNDKFTNTGRLSCEDPNAQNFPKRKHKEVRSVIHAGLVPNDPLRSYKRHKVIERLMKLVSADYGQIEARVIAMATQDDRFVESLWHDLDIHMDWTERFMEADPTWIERVAKKMELDIENTPRDKLVKAARNVTKNSWVFPRFFGAADYSCAGYMDVSESLASELGAVFWEEFAGVKEWQDSLMSFYKKHGYVETLTGRRRFAPVAFNEIINTPIQGTASDIVTDAGDRCSDAGFQICMNVHDDLTFRRHPDTWKQDVEEIAKIMVNPPFDFINVPISIEVEVGTNWANQKEYKVYESNKM